MTEPIGARPDYAVGQSVDVSLNLSASPFTDESLIAFSDAYNKKLQDSSFDNQGNFEMFSTLVQTESEKAKALGIEGELDFSFGPVSGDANVQFAMDNIQGKLDLTMVVRAKQDGRVIKNELSQLVKLKLRESVLNKIKNDEKYTLDAFKKQYGSYLIYGFDYGGEIRFSSTYSTNSKEDKLAVGGALSVSFGKMGFNVSGSAKGNYKSSDISKSTNIKTESYIKPSFDDAIINGPGGIIDLLGKISDPVNNGINVDDDEEKSAGQIKSDLYRKMQKLLGGAKLDPVNAIIYPIDKLSCVVDAFTNWDSVNLTPFFQSMNPLYQSLKEIHQGIKTIDTNYGLYDKDNKPQKEIDLYLNALNINIKKMEIISGDALYEYAKKWYDYTMNRNIDHDDDDDKDSADQDAELNEVTKEFYKIDKNILESEFNKSLFNPYNEMMKRIADEAADDIVPSDDITYGCRIKLQHVNTKKRLHLNIPFPSGYEKRVTCTSGSDDDNDYWIIKPTHDKANDATIYNTSVQNGDIIRLRHYVDLSDMYCNNNEVICIDHIKSDLDIKNDKFYWKVEIINNDKIWKNGNKIRLIPVSDGSKVLGSQEEKKIVVGPSISQQGAFVQSSTGGPLSPIANEWVVDGFDKDQIY